MKKRYIFGSIARISDLPNCEFTVEVLPKTRWETGDYIVGEATDTAGCLRNVELINGRMIEVLDGDLIVGALGQRAATLEAVGDWRDIGDDLSYNLMTAAGLSGKVTSKSAFVQKLMPMRYLGHVLKNGTKTRMNDYVEIAAEKPLNIPIVLIIGTSMSAGKTLSARVITHCLSQAGLRVIGAKLTGAARFRDVLSMGDAGAERIFDFVDMGLPSTVCPEDEYRTALRNLLNRIAAVEADVIVAEAGASPLEPYNGNTAVAEISPWVRCTVLCASDPYAVVGVCEAFKRKPDIVAGGAANTEAAAKLVEKLTGLNPLNLMNKSSWPRLEEILKDRLGLF
ncbi:MAG: hypothetical protein ACU843_05625 [Gammaproteobacteria bacterium]